MNEVTGQWRKLHNGELHNLYSSPDIIRQIKSRRMRWAGHMACMGEMCTGFWWESLKEKDHLRDQGIDGIKMGLMEIGWGAVEWIHLTQDRDCWQALVKAVMNLRVLVPQS
jgi:hypothetical protein